MIMDIKKGTSWLPVMGSRAADLRAQDIVPKLGDRTAMPEFSTSDVKVADSARTAQPTVLEVPVTVQGSKPVEGQEKRELFTETTKTTLVFGNGAVVNLASRLLAGQCVFLRNENSGREILCKVLESRPAGPTNYTDLEFTAHDPNFWDAQPVHAAPPSQPVQPDEISSPEQKSEAQNKIDAAVASLSATAMMESSTPASEDFPAPFPQEEDTEPEHSSSESSLALPKHASESAREEVKELEPNDEADAERLAALIAMDGKPKPNRELAAGATRQTPPDSGSVPSPAPTKTTSISILELRLRTLPFAGALRNPIGIGVAASLLIAATVSVGWHLKRGSSASSNASRPFAVSASPKQVAQPANAQPLQTPPAAIALNSSIPTPSSAALPEPTAAKGTENAPAVISVKASIPGSNEAIVAKPRHRKANDASGQDIVPAKILSQSQPGIPSWAQGIDTDGIVQLDALIDEKGNVKETKPLSGPRALQKEAERVVALWVFEPAMAGGKPTATHMVLTVQFQM
jgi:Gram-negative bacterial TonB protein C-terminal